MDGGFGDDRSARLVWSPPFALDPPCARCAALQTWAHVDELRGYLRRRIPADDVDDVIQDIFMRLVQRGGATVDHPRRYLFKVALRTLIDRRRAARSRRAELHCELLDTDLPPDELSPERHLAAREDVKAARAVLAGLPPRTRDILVAIRIDGGTAKAVAAQHGISVSAVEKHLVRALRALRQGPATADAG